MKVSRYVAILGWTVFFALLLAEGFGLAMADDNTFYLITALVISALASAMDTNKNAAK